MFSIQNILSRFNPKWVLNLYPPFFFNKIKVQSVSKDFTQVKVKIKKSFWNRNMAGTIFGGTLFSSADPFIAIMYWQIFKKRYQQDIIVWLKGASIEYKIPASTDMFLHFEIKEEEILEAKKELDSKGKHIAPYTVNIENTKGEVCAIVKLDSYLGIVREKT